MIFSVNGGCSHSHAHLLEGMNSSYFNIIPFNSLFNESLEVMLTMASLIVEIMSKLHAARIWILHGHTICHAVVSKHMEKTGTFGYEPMTPNCTISSARWLDSISGSIKFKV